MKDEPWRGDPSARCLHLEGKISRQKAEIRNRVAQLDAAQAELDATKLLYGARLGAIGSKHAAALEVSHFYAGSQVILMVDAPEFLVCGKDAIPTGRLRKLLDASHDKDECVRMIVRQVVEGVERALRRLASWEQPAEQSGAGRNTEAEVTEARQQEPEE